MWLFTRHGFYSITRSVKEPDKLQIRARARGDLENLEAFIATREIPTADALAVDLSKIIETPHADYRYRVIVTPAAWHLISVELMADIVYSNFKYQIKDNQRHTDYTRVWGIMNQVQSRETWPDDQYSLWGGNDEDDSFYDNITDYGDPADDWQPGSLGDPNLGDPKDDWEATSFFWDK